MLSISPSDINRYQVALGNLDSSMIIEDTNHIVQFANQSFEGGAINRL